MDIILTCIQMVCCKLVASYTLPRSRAVLKELSRYIPLLLSFSEKRCDLGWKAHGEVSEVGERRPYSLEVVLYKRFWGFAHGVVRPCFTVGVDMQEKTGFPGLEHAFEFSICCSLEADIVSGRKHTAQL